MQLWLYKFGLFRRFLNDPKMILLSNQGSREYKSIEPFEINR
jgi:hypothetical protein